MPEPSRSIPTGQRIGTCLPSPQTTAGAFLHVDNHSSNDEFGSWSLSALVPTGEKRRRPDGGRTSAGWQLRRGCRRCVPTPLWEGALWTWQISAAPCELPCEVYLTLFQACSTLQRREGCINVLSTSVALGLTSSSSPDCPTLAASGGTPASLWRLNQEFRRAWGTSFLPAMRVGDGPCLLCTWTSW